MTVIDEHRRTEPPVDGDELATLTGFLDYQRATFRWKCAGLDAAGFGVTVGASTMTLGGLMNHLSIVEDWWFSQSLHGRETPAPPWDTVDWDADRDYEWHVAATETPDVIRARWEASVERSRELLAAALAEGGLDRRAVRVPRTGGAPTLRWVLVHMIEEYARHNGHADLLREAVDGETGE
jgi:uncharacterized damage-inducible protein DinB